MLGILSISVAVALYYLIRSIQLSRQNYGLDGSPADSLGWQGRRLAREKAEAEEAWREREEGCDYEGADDAGLAAGGAMPKNCKLSRKPCRRMSTLEADPDDVELTEGDSSPGPPARRPAARHTERE